LGRPPKPIELKRRLGNPGQRRLPDVRHTIALDPLNQGEFMASEEPVSALLRRVDAPWLTYADEPALQLLRDAVDDYERLRASEGADFRDVIAARGQILDLLDLLGLTPTGRARLAVAEIKRLKEAER
jgi:hypothetical protein